MLSFYEYSGIRWKDVTELFSCIKPMNLLCKSADVFVNIPLRRYDTFYEKSALVRLYFRKELNPYYLEIDFVRSYEKERGMRPANWKKSD